MPLTCVYSLVLGSSLKPSLAFLLVQAGSGETPSEEGLGSLQPLQADLCCSRCPTPGSQGLALSQFSKPRSQGPNFLKRRQTSQERPEGKFFSAPGQPCSEIPLLGEAGQGVKGAPAWENGS